MTLPRRRRGCYGGEGVVAKDSRAPYRPGQRTGMVKVKRVRTIDAVVVGYRPGKEPDTVGSLILGLYDTDGTLHVVGHSSGLRAAEKRALVAKLAPYETGHRGHGDPSRWKNEKELEWIDPAAGARRRDHVRPHERRPDPPRDEDPPLARRQAAARVPARADGQLELLRSEPGSRRSSSPRLRGGSRTRGAGVTSRAAGRAPVATARGSRPRRRAPRRARRASRP